MTAQWTLISRTTVSTGTSVTFNSIGSYESYRIIAYSGDNAGSDYFRVDPNNTGTDRYSRGFFANTGSGSVQRNSFTYIALGINATNNSAETTKAVNIIDIGFAQSTTIIKPLIGFGGWAGNMVRVSAGAWAQTGTAISSIVCKTGSAGTADFRSNTVIALYGRNV